MSHNESQRIAVLDGLRGIAILSVIGFHYFARWPEFYPYGQMFAAVEPVATGYAGVYLFFLVSGFVIARSLSASRTLLEFIAKRLDRLLIPMMVLSTLTFALLSGPLATEHFEVRWSDFVPSWTFTEPALWRFIDPQVGYIDGVYWTLFLEVRFYALFAFLWFAFGSRRATLTLAFVAIIAPLAHHIIRSHNIPGGSALELVVFPAYIPLFASGVLYSSLMTRRSWVVDVILLSLVVPSSLFALTAVSPAHQQVSVALLCAAFHAVMCALTINPRFIGALAFKPLVGVGVVSYSLYLIHQNVGVALISRIPSTSPLWLQIGGTLGVASLMLALAACSWLMFERHHVFRHLLRLGTQKKLAADGAY